MKLRDLADQPLLPERKPVMNLKELFTKLLEDCVFPAVDEIVKEWHMPFEIDDRIWERIKDAVRQRLLLSSAVLQSGSYSLLSETGTFMEASVVTDLFVQFVRQVVYPIIDQYVKEQHTVFEWDDKVWAILKKKIDEYLDGVRIEDVGNGNFTLGRM